MPQLRLLGGEGKALQAVSHGDYEVKHFEPPSVQSVRLYLCVTNALR